jgi:hypothetical protein
MAIRGRYCFIKEKQMMIVLKPPQDRTTTKPWEIIADNLSKAGWSLGLRLGD